MGQLKKERQGPGQIYWHVKLLSEGLGEHREKKNENGMKGIPKTKVKCVTL